MAGKNQHVVPRNGGWGVRGEGNTRDSSQHTTQKGDYDAARGIAQNQHSEVVIHGRNGQIRDKNSFGNDPNPPKDKR